MKRQDYEQLTFFPEDSHASLSPLPGSEEARMMTVTLWPEMLRVIREIRPTWVLGENVPGIVNLALDQVLSELENEGYAVQAFIIPACGVDAPHKRERVAILAYAIDRCGPVRWDRKLPDAKGHAAGRTDHGIGETATVTGQRREDQSGTSGMADGLRTCIHRTDSDTDRDGLERRSEESLVSVERETENKIRGVYWSAPITDC